MTANRPAESACAACAAPHPIALLRSHDDLRRAVRQWCAENRITRMELDARAGLADGHASKLLAIHPHKKFGSKSMWRVLAANGLTLALVVDPDRKSPPNMPATMQACRGGSAHDASAARLGQADGSAPSAQTDPGAAQRDRPQSRSGTLEPCKDQIAAAN